LSGWEGSHSRHGRSIVLAIVRRIKAELENPQGIENNKK
jgi:hypothetical protein